MSPAPNQETKCPACGLVVKGTEHTCPQCGRDFGTDFGFECPFCGDFILKGSTKCPSCHLSLTDFAEKTSEKTVEEVTDQLLDEIISIESAQVKSEDKHLACPGCHWLLRGEEVKCPKCNRAISSVSELLCPICSSPVGSNLDKCSKCGSQLRKGHFVLLPPPSPPKDTRKTPDQALDELLLDFKSMTPCPKCGTPATPGTSVCPKCGSYFSIEEELREDLKELESIDSGKELPDEDLVDEALDKLGQIEKQAQSVKRSRKLRSEKVTTVGPQIRPTGKGLTNGVGQVNGNSFVNGTSKATAVGRINGTRFTNGKSMVNGTGISNGLKPRTRAAGINKMALLVSWRFLVILVAVVVVISSLAAVSFLNKGDRFSADGDFGEWSDEPMFGARVQSSSPTIDIVEWSVATDSNELFFFVQTRGTIMGSTDAQRFYLFVDTDGSSSTGYLIDSLGAEYMLQVDGWNGSVQSTTMNERDPNGDQYDFSGWSPVGSFVAFSKGSELEAEATFSRGLGQQSRFILLSKDSLADGAVSHIATSSGGNLVVTQTPSPAVIEYGVIGAGSSVTVLNITFSCEGIGGTVNSVTPLVERASVVTSISTFSLKAWQSRTFSLAVDTTGLADGQLVTAEIGEDCIESTFTSIEIIGERASAYVGSSPGSIKIDGAFADWANKTMADEDLTPVKNRDIDISEIGNVNASGSSYFYVSVEGEMCSGTFIPATIVKPSGDGGGGGGGVYHKVTAEDILRIYVDSDKSSSTGFTFRASSKTIGADQMIEVRGLDGHIVSTSESDYVSGSWVNLSAPVEAAKDSKRIEIGVSATSLNGSSDIDFVIETTTWSGASDTATMIPSGVRSLTSSFSGGMNPEDWAVDGSTSGIYATAMSYQRKVFFDGTNYWSFYWDGMNSVHKYSTDDGVTWTRMGTFFKTGGVNETSIWYDSANNVVYAVGDTSTASMTVVLQKGTVNPSGHNISWAASDSTATVSSNNLAGKNTFICRDANGYIWILATNCSQTQPVRYDLTAFKSTAVNSISSWAYSGQMLGAPSTTSNPKGSIVPAGSGSDVWAIYAYGGNVASRKYTGTWQTPQTTIYTGGGSSANTDNSPPSVVVDSRGVVHVVYGTGRKTGGSTSIPTIEYARNNTGLTTFTTPVDLDAYIPAGVGDYYPTISLESSTDSLYVFWLRSDTSLVPQTVTGRKCVSGTWSNLTLSSQTTYAKQYLTSIYSVSGESKICWQWTQNATAPYEVMFDTKIPEFSGIVVPVLFIMMVFFVKRSGSKRGKSHSSM